MSDDGVRSFEVVGCPVATYFHVERLVDPGLATFRDSDYALSEMRGLPLRRACTLMAGDDYRDVRRRIATQCTRTGTKPKGIATKN